MRNNYKVLIGIIIIIVIFLTGCTKPISTENPLDSKVDDLNKEIEELNIKVGELTEENKELNAQINNNSNSNPNPNPNQSQSLISTALDVMELIKNKDMSNLSAYVHPSSGLRFTPYFYVDIQNDQDFTAQQVASLDQDTTVFHWGDYDGSGEPIDLDFNDYYDEFIYNQDFINPHIIGNNTPIGIGNMIDNVSNEYSNGNYVEFHFTGFDQQYSGIDWNSLRLVFEQSGGQWYLVGIVHGQWTI